MRIVLDTNVLISAFISHGACAELIEHCFTHHEVVGSEHLLREFQAKLVSRFSIPSALARQAALLLRSRMELVQTAKIKDNSCRDKDDLPILGAAKAGHCRCIITGDRDLLDIKSFESADILSPQDFWRYEAALGES